MNILIAFNNVGSFIVPSPDKTKRFAYYETVSVADKNVTEYSMNDFEIWSAERRPLDSKTNWRT